MTNDMPPPFENRPDDIPAATEQGKVQELENYLEMTLTVIREGHPWSVNVLLLFGLQARLQTAIDGKISPYWRYRPLNPSTEPFDLDEFDVPDYPEGLT